MLDRLGEVLEAEIHALKIEDKLLSEIQKNLDRRKLSEIELLESKSLVSVFSCSDSRLDKNIPNSIFLVFQANNEPESLAGIFSREEIKQLKEGKVTKELLGKADFGEFGGVFTNLGGLANSELAKNGDVIQISHSQCEAHQLEERRKQILDWLDARGYKLGKLGVSEGDFKNIPADNAKEEVKKMTAANPHRRVVGVFVDFESGVAKIVAMHKAKMPSEIEIPSQKLHGELLKSELPTGIAIGKEGIDLQKVVDAAPGNYFVVTDDDSSNSKVSLTYAVAHLNRKNNIREIVFVARSEGEARELRDKWRADILFRDLEKGGVEFVTKTVSES
jgi:hypothetical protein